MDICRTCLSSKVKKLIFDLQSNIDDRTYLDIMNFCLDIKVTTESKLSTKLCLKCYKKIINFYEFKVCALKNDAYLKSQHSHEEDNKIEIHKTDEAIRVENSTVNSLSAFVNVLDPDLEVKQEWNVKEEDAFCDLSSDDEILSVLKNVKFNGLVDEEKENSKLKNKKGRPKGSRTSTKDIEKKKKEVCEECGKSVSNLKEHALRHQPAGDRKRVQCKMCDKMFSSFSARYKHYKIKHLGIKQHCNICNKDVVSLKQHDLVMHNSEALPHGCVPCGRRFISQSALELHMTVHTKDRPHECDICQNKYRSKLALLQHKRQVHDKEKTHLCQFCSKGFFKKYHLQVHLRSHTKERPYKCNKCGKFFSSSSTLKDHGLIHSEVKKFECTRCDMTFSKPGYLRNHMISHTRARPHTCKYCGIGFGRSDHRKRHEYTAHERHLAT